MIATIALATVIVCQSPARDWQQSSITGNGTIGAMVRGDVNNDTVSLSHCRLYMPISDEGGYRERDPFMAACDLKMGTDVWGIRDYSRTTDFETGEVIVRCQSQHGEYVRKVVALRPDNLIAIKVGDKRHIRFALDSIPMRGRDELAMFEDGVRSVVHERREGLDYYRLDWSRTNKWNKLTGYEVALLVNNSRENDIEAFVAIEPILKGQESNFASMKSRLEAAAAKGYDALVENHAKRQREMMRRVEFALESTGEVKGDFIEKAFQAGRYNIISATGGAHVPNLQGVWAGTWSAPWRASFTTNGNMPCAVSFFTKGATPELCGSLLAWLEERLPEMREGAKQFYNARGFHVAAQTTVSGVETDTNDGYPHRYWHAGAQWIMNTLFDAWRTTHSKKWLKRIYPLMKETAQYYEDVLVELPDGTLGFNPSYSPENWPQGKRPTAVNATMDQAAARQCFRNAIEAAEALGTGGSGVPPLEQIEKWRTLLSRLTPYAVSEGGYFAEWLAPGQPDNNEHRHASHLYALYDDAPAEIVTNAALVAAVKKTIDARMDFNENRSRTMAFGYVQLGLAATKIGDGERALRCLNLLSKKNWTEAFGSFHDWHNIFNTDISGGYPYLVSEMLVQSDNDSVTFLPAKPECWTRGRIAGLALRGAVKLESLEWEGDSWNARLKTEDGRTLNFSGTGRNTVSTK